ncbi:unnamed protein product [Somion occarium]|uniref:DUF7918 domain-containing protein n=1 Tax=Somion occarium TaxID=3059160 RepID=A0ABP1DSP1_9APHY
MLGIRGLSAYMRIGGQEVTEYGVILDDAAHSVGLYVASEVDKELEILMKNTLDNDKVTFRVYLDGLIAGGFICKPGRSTICKHACVGSQYQTLKFAPIVTTDDEHAASKDTKFINDLGTIEIRAHRCLEQISTDVQLKANKSWNISPIHELTKKAGTHRVTLGATDPSYAPKLTQTTLIDPSDHPFATFLFRYRPLAILQAEGIAPLTPAPAAAEQSMAPEERTDISTHLGEKRRQEEAGPSERPPRKARTSNIPNPRESASEVVPKPESKEAASLRAQLQAIQARLDQIEGAGSVKKETVDSSKRIKKERIHSRTFADVIDLTED